MRSKSALSVLFFGFVFLGAGISTVSAQNGIKPQKRVVIRRLIEVSELSRHTSGIFEELTTLYQASWTLSVIADLKAKGLFNKSTPQQVAKVERIIDEFSTDLFGEIKKRMRSEIFSDDALEKMAGPIFDKYLSEDEINELIIFSQAPPSRTLTDTYYKVITDALILNMKEKGVFNVESNPSVEEAKFERLKKESESNPLDDIRKIFATVQRLASETYTQNEMEELSALRNRPLATKLMQILPLMAIEIRANSMQFYGPQVGKLTQEVIDKQLKTLERRFSGNDK